MKFTLLLLLLMAATVNDEPYRELLLTAEALVKQEKRENAKDYFQKAAKLGSAEAHFKLAYLYVVTKQEAIYHYSESAKNGHEEALKHALDFLLFRANSLALADPRKAFEIYKLSKSVNPNVKLFDEEEKLKIIKMAAEVPPLDVPSFIKNYQLDKEKNFGKGAYYIWELAELASQGKRFKEPSSELVLQLIIRGGSVPAETSAAIEDYYAFWKKKSSPTVFNLCDYITSRSGGAFCANRKKTKK